MNGDSAAPSPPPAPADVGVPGPPAPKRRPRRRHDWSHGPWDAYEVDPQRFASGMLYARQAAVDEGERAALRGKTEPPAGYALPPHFRPDWWKGWERGCEHLRALGRDVPVRRERKTRKPRPRAARGTGDAA